MRGLKIMYERSDLSCQLRLSYRFWDVDEGYLHPCFGISFSKTALILLPLNFSVSAPLDAISSLSFMLIQMEFSDFTSTIGNYFGRLECSQKNSVWIHFTLKLFSPNASNQITSLLFPPRICCVFLTTQHAKTILLFHLVCSLSTALTILPNLHI